MRLTKTQVRLALQAVLRDATAQIRKGTKMEFEEQ